MKKIMFVWLAAVIVVGVGAFYGGTKYATDKSPRPFGNLTDEQRQQFGQMTGTLSGQRGTRVGSNVMGEIISKDDSSITVRLRDGGSKIVFLSPSTEVSVFTSGTANDLSVGTTVVAGGSANDDGSITAQTIQVRPAMPNEAK